MLQRVAGTISRYRMFEHGHKVGVAVSGGADSICLLHILAELAPRWALRLSVLHLDHQLRGEESRQDAEFVRSTAAKLGLAAHIRETDVDRLRALTGENLEQAARDARREFFAECINSGLVDRVALGHTLSDQAETVIFRLLRGCGPSGLAGIPPVTPNRLVRPLLEVRRSEVERFLRERGIAWREDSSNRNPAYARNRIRHDLLPALTRDWNPALPEALARLAGLVRGEEEYWGQTIQALAETQFTRQGQGVVLRTEYLQQMPRPVASRLIRRAIEEVKGNLKRVEFEHVETILKMCEGPEGEARAQIPGLEALRSFGWLRLAPIQPPGQRTLRTALSVPGSAPVGSSGVVLNLEEWGGESTWDGGGLDEDRLPGPLELRNWRPGDRYRLPGHAAPERVKLLFQKHKVPLWERREWPVVVSGEQIVWVRRFGPAAEYAAGPQSRRIIKIVER